MDRKIKFRAWDRIEKEMARSVNEMNFNSKGLYGLKVNHLGFEFKRRRKDVALMQFTGLKDKNGVDIYEGDIVKVHRSELSIVKFKHGSYGFIGEDTGDFITFADTWSGCEVIGNIYENKNLLEEN